MFGYCCALERNVDGRNYHRNSAVTCLCQQFNDLPLHKAFHRNITTSTMVETINDMIQQHGGKVTLSTVYAMGNGYDSVTCDLW